MVRDNLRPSAQCSKAASTALAVLVQILRAFHFRDRFTFISLSQKYVRPHLEFAMQAWCSCTNQDREALKKVQKRAVGTVSGLKAAHMSRNFLE